MSDEYPKIYYREDWEARGYDGIIEENMVLCVESYTGAVGAAEGVKLEEQVLVTSRGCEVLSDYPFDARLLRRSRLSAGERLRTETHLPRLDLPADRRGAHVQGTRRHPRSSPCGLPPRRR